MLQHRVLASTTLTKIQIKTIFTKRRIIPTNSLRNTSNYSNKLTIIRHLSIIKSNDTIRKQQYVSECLMDKIKNGDIYYDKIQEKAALRFTKLQKVLHKVHSEETINNEAVSMPIDKISIKEEKVVTATNTPAKPAQQEPAKDPNTIDNAKEDTPKTPKKIIKGLYIHGPVGCGKTMLMDTFYSLTSSTSSNKIKRIHYYKFMQEIHQELHTIKKEYKLIPKLNPSLYGRNANKHNPMIIQNKSPMEQVAQKIASSTSILCIDEFQVIDIADAFLLSQLFTLLFQNYNVILICTSNLAPDKLYENGLNREYFLPFLDMLYRYCIVHSMDVTTKTSLVSSQRKNKQVDYRRVLSLKGNKSTNDFYYIYKNEKEYITSKSKCLDMIQSLSIIPSSNTIMEPQSTTLNTVFNRTLYVPTAILSNKTKKQGIVCHFTYKDLCETELGSAEYHAISSNFHAVILEGIPKLQRTKKQLDSSRRFITLIDELYDNSCALVCTAECDIDSLFSSSCLVRRNGYSDDDGVFWNGGDGASITELQYAFQRSKSRLYQMCSEAWWDEHVFRNIEY